jgi:hypothetical protein
MARFTIWPFRIGSTLSFSPDDVVTWFVRGKYVSWVAICSDNGTTGYILNVSCVSLRWINRDNRWSHLDEGIEERHAIIRDIGPGSSSKHRVDLIPEFILELGMRCEFAKPPRQRICLSVRWELYNVRIRLTVVSCPARRSKEVWAAISLPVMAFLFFPRSPACTANLTPSIWVVGDEKGAETVT